MAQALPEAAGGTSGPAGRAGTAGDRGRRGARTTARSEPNARGPRRGNGPREPRRLRPRRADASGLSLLPLRRGVCRLRRWAEARVRSGRCHQGASSLRTTRRPRLWAAAGAGKLSHGARTLPAPPLPSSLDSRLCSEPRRPGQGSPPPRRTQAQRACKSGLGWETLLPPPLSHPRHPAPSPSHPRPPPTRLHLAHGLRVYRAVALTPSPRASALSPPWHLELTGPRRHSGVLHAPKGSQTL